MALPIDAIRKVFTDKGKLVFRRTGSEPGNGGVVGDQVARVAPNYLMATIQIGIGVITMTATKDDDPHANVVNCVYESDLAATGAVTPPGYAYTDSMSGCAFYVFRGMMGEVHGVHASRQSGRLIDPTDYFTRRGGKLLYKYDSLGRLSDASLLGGSFSGVFCCIDQDRITAFALELKGQDVKSIIEEKVVDNWRRA